MIFFLSLTFMFSQGIGAAAELKNMVHVPGGTYLPFYADKKSEKPEPVQVKTFMMDIYPVTNSEYLDFVKQVPNWRRSRIKGIFTDGHYLQYWKTDILLPKGEVGKTPVTFISWFAAKAFCESNGKRLPTTDQWEYAAYDQGRHEKDMKDLVLQWYSKPNDKLLPAVGSTPKNDFGIYDLQGVIWEWTYDFNTPSGSDSSAFCGGGAADAAKSSDYVNYMRYAFRASLKANYTTANLGFRCVKEIEN